MWRWSILSHEGNDVILDGQNRLTLNPSYSFDRLPSGTEEFKVATIYGRAIASFEATVKAHDTTSEFRMVAFLVFESLRILTRPRELFDSVNARQDELCFRRLKAEVFIPLANRTFPFEDF